MRAADLPEAASFEALRSAGGRDLRFDHALADSAPGGAPVRGRTLFGPGRPSLPPLSERAVTSVLLHDAVLDPAAMAVLDSRLTVFADGIDNLPDRAVLTRPGGPWTRSADGVLAFSVAAIATAAPDLVALPVCGPGLPNYGHFLFDGLPAVLLQALAFPDLPWRVVGQALRPWQAEILDLVGLGARYLPLAQPTRFARLLTSTLLSMHVSHPTRFIRPLFDLLRFRVGPPPADAPRRVFLSRAGHDGVRTLRNRAAVEAAMALAGFAVVEPSALPVARQAALLAGARFVAGESGAALANIGFCAPGTVVLEIQPDCFADTWIRGTCRQLGHRWHLYAVAADAPPAAPGGPFAFAIDPLDLMTAVATIEAAG